MPRRRNPEDYDDPFDAYLDELCDEVPCERRATHNQGVRKVCNQHLEPDARAFARND